MRITMIGSGNVATHLAAAFKNAGHVIGQVWSRNFDHASLLAYHVKAEAVAAPEELDTRADLYIVAVNDDAIGEVVAKLRLKDQLLVHTSGSTPMSVLDGASAQTGVLYPLQTLSKLKSVDFQKVPVAVEGNSAHVLSKLKTLAWDITGNVIELTSEKRLSLHVAAVFACNFTNHLYSLSKTVLDKYALSFDLLRPLIEETALKAMTYDPRDVQTGPAVRNDVQIMNKHLGFLEADEELKLIYKLFSQSIINFDKNH